MFWPGGDDGRCCEAVKRSEYCGNSWAGRELLFKCLLGGLWAAAQQGRSPTVTPTPGSGGPCPSQGDLLSSDLAVPRGTKVLNLDAKEQGTLREKRVATGGGNRYSRGIGRGGFSECRFVAQKRRPALNYRYRVSLAAMPLKNYSLGLIFLNSEARMIASAISFIGLRILRLCC